MEGDGDEKQDKPKKKPSKYCYTFGDKHPVRKKTELVKVEPGVPASMGWLWTHENNHAPSMKIRKGWAPGSVSKAVAKMMTFKVFRGGGPEKNKKGKKKKKAGGGVDVSGGDSEFEDPLTPKPALKIQRKGDLFTIQVNPLKDLTKIAPTEDPYVNCDPIIFKILKKRSPEEQAKVEARKMVKLKKKRDAEIRKALAEATEDICKCAYMDVYCNDMSAIDNVIDLCPAFQEPPCICKDESFSSLSSNGTWDIEYTPPFGCFDMAPRKTRKFISVETQYCGKDIGLESVHPPSCCSCNRKSKK